jgi:hypothetical protein
VFELGEWGGGVFNGGAWLEIEGEAGVRGTKGRPEPSALRAVAEEVPRPL